MLLSVTLDQDFAGSPLLGYERLAQDAFKKFSDNAHWLGRDKGLTCQEIQQSRSGDSYPASLKESLEVAELITGAAPFEGPITVSEGF